MLWQKESGKRDALYVDLFTKEDKELLEMTFTMTKLDNAKPAVKKSIEDSLQHRKQGNQLFANGDFKKAIEMYNKSLCLAPPSSALAGLAYSNRSICFLKQKMYKECLVDIELDRQCDYPEHLIFKLDEREVECAEGIKRDEQIADDIGLKLSYDPDKTYPCLATVLNVEKDGDGSFTVTAKEDISAGKTIAVENAFATYSIISHNVKCNICLKRNTNLVPCNRCTSAMLCHDKCKNNNLHESECGLEFSGIGDLDAGVLKEVRIILMIVDMFPNADELMDFVERAIKHVPMNSLPTVSAAKCRYRDFLNLQFSQNGPNAEQFVTSLYFMYKLALEVPKVKMYFKTEKHRRFLIHLIGLHSHITDDNSNWSKRLFEINGQLKNVCTHGIIGLRNRFFGLSCAPNVVHCDHNDLSVYITIRPVAKGEPLLTFIADHFLLESKPKRQQAFQQLRQATCKCSRCEGLVATAAQQQEITSNPDYCNVSSRQLHGTDVDVQQKYVAFLNEYGQIPWCDAIGTVVDAYVYLLRNKISGETFSSDVLEAIGGL